MTPYDFIRCKKEGGVNDPRSIKEFVRGYVEGAVADYQMAAWLMAVAFNGLNEEEITAYTEALIDSGKRFDLSRIPGFKVDKHSTGGVGDKVSLILAPLVAACGVPVPMVSGKGLGHTGGTLDKLAAIPGFRTDLSVDEFKRFLGEIGVAMMGQTRDLCPADGMIYALRDVTATVESIPLIAASISAKKIAEGTQGLVLDVKVGSGAFIREEKDTEELTRMIISLTKKFGVRTTAVLTNMNQPLGRSVGNALEVCEAIECLKGKKTQDLRNIVLELAAQMLLLSGRENHETAIREAEAVLDSGRALDKFRKLVEMQGGDARIVDEPSRLPQACAKIPVNAQASGIIQSIDTYRVGILAVELGAGRRSKDDAIDPGVGFEIRKKIGDEVAKNEPLALIYANEKNETSRIAPKLAACFRVGKGDIKAPQLIVKRLP